MKKISRIICGLMAASIFASGLSSCSDEVTESAPAVVTQSKSGEEKKSAVQTQTGSVYTYNDNYAASSGWSNKSKWNLANTHDPTVFKWTDGYWYMFGTDASYGNEHEKASSGKHFQGKRSKNLVDWEWVPGIMDEAPDWVVTKLNEFRTKMGVPTLTKQEISWGFWAPCARVIEVGGVKKVRIYYSIVVDNYIKTGAKTSTAFDGSWSERAFIGVAESTNPNGGPGAWEDKGFVLCSSSDKGKDGFARSRSNSYGDVYFYFNAIDPTYFIDDDGSHWMVYGSWHSGFALVRINPETGKVAAVDGNDYLSGNVTGDFEMKEPWADDSDGLVSNGYGTRIFSRGTSRWQPSEGPELVKKDEYYWLFFANDALDVPYQSRVVRSTSIKGPYSAIDGSEMTNDVDGKRNASVNIYPIVTHPYKFNDADNGLGSCYGWVGISHCAIFNDGDNWYYMSQQRLPVNVADNQYSNAIMMGGVRKIVWTPSEVGGTDLWPIALPERYAGLSSEKVTESDISGEWQHINLAYNKGVMDEAVNLTLSADHKMSGVLIGTWAFNETSQLLTFTPASGTAVSVKVSRELDWEANPRKLTVVYAGTQKTLDKTYWGKKVSGTIQSYAEKYAVAELKSTYTMTLIDSAKDDLSWYLYPQFGAWNYVVDDGSGEKDSALVSGAEAWWQGTDLNKSAKYTISDGGKLTLYASTTATNGTLVIEGVSSAANKYATINPHGSADTDSWGEAVSSWTRNVAGVTAGVLSLKIEITRNGATQVLKIYKL